MKRGGAFPPLFYILIFYEEYFGSFRFGLYAIASNYDVLF